VVGGIVRKEKIKNTGGWSGPTQRASYQKRRGQIRPKKGLREKTSTSVKREFGGRRGRHRDGKNSQDRMGIKGGGTRGF